MKLINIIYTWCKANSTIAHIIGASILALSYFVIGWVWSLIFSSVFFIGKEFLDRKTTGFSWSDLAIDYAAWGVVTIGLILIF